MKITILTSDKQHPVYDHLMSWKMKYDNQFDIELLTDIEAVSGGDFLFLISCSQIAKKNTRSLYKHSLVVHASDLPKGRGWSPHIWQILEGQKEIPVTLLEAEDEIDSGHIWLQKKIKLAGHELYDEINNKLFEATLSLMTQALSQYDEIKPQAQRQEKATYYRKRTPADSKIQPKDSIEDIFNILRVSDPHRYPAFFHHKGHKYLIEIKKDENISDEA